MADSAEPDRTDAKEKREGERESQMRNRLS